MRLVSIGDRVAAGIYPFHSRFNRAVNFVQDGRLVSVVAEEVGDGPLSIVLRDFDAGVTEDPLEISADQVLFDGCEFPFTPRHRYCSMLESQNGPRLRSNLAMFEELLAETSPPNSLAFLIDDARLSRFRSGFEQKFVEQVKRSVHQIFHGDRLAGVRKLGGCGIGLTPSGDDFIAGHLIALNLRGETANDVFEAARSNNIFSNTFLDLARQGRLFGRMKNLILALTHGSKMAVRECTEKLFAVGGTSGADLGTGFYLTMNL
jgi:Protein of unknown function (DUF2877)